MSHKHKPSVPPKKAEPMHVMPITSFLVENSDGNEYFSPEEMQVHLIIFLILTFNFCYKTDYTAVLD